MTNVGTISLDLVIKESLKSQLNDIKANVQNAMSKPMEQASAAVNKAVDKAFESADKTVEDFRANTKGELERMAQEAVKRVRTVSDEASKPVTVTYVDQYDSAQIEEEINKITDKISDKVSETVEKAKEKLSNFEISTDPVERLEQELENTLEKSSLLQKKWQELNEDLSKTQNDADASKIISQINATEKQLISLQNQADRTRAKIEETNDSGASSFSKFRSKITSFAKSSATVIKSGLVSAVKGLKTAVGSTAGTVTKKLGGAFKSLKSVAGKAIDNVKSKFSGLHSSVGSIEKPVSRLGRSIKNAFRRVFVMAGILALLKALRSAITDTANKNDEFAKSLNEIKANLQIAFLPIINAVMPAINALMSGLAQVTKMIAAFTNEMFGTTYKKSLDTLKKAQKANKDAAKEAKKNSTYLNSYDEMNVAQDTSSDSSSSSSSDDSGIDYSAINGDNVKLPDWAQRMKDAIKAGDWKGVGGLLAEKLNSAMDAINWDKIQSKVNGAMRGLADFLNGFMEKLDWKKLGETFANGINTIFGGIYTFMKRFNWSKLGKSIAEFMNSAIKKTDWELIGRTLASKWVALIDTLYAFVTNFDWSGFGQSIGTSVNAWFDEIDWKKTALTLSEGVKGLLDSIMGFIETVDWEQIGEDLWTFVKNIDWAGIIEKLAKLIGEAIAGIAKLLWGFIKEAVYGIRDYFRDKIEESGGNIIEGLWNGIVDAFKAVGSWIKEHIFKPFMEGFKKVFGIHSPSTVMAEMGGYIIEGLKNAIIKGIETVREAFKKILEAIHKVFAKIGEWFKEKFGGAWEKIKEVFSLTNIKEFFGRCWDKIKNPFVNIGKWFRNIFAKAWQGVKDVTKTVWDKIVDVVKAPINMIIGAVNGMLNAVEKAINWVINGINDLSFDVPDWVPGIGGSKFGFDIPTIDIPEIPKLATGGLATAPTLSMVGDNRNAKVDPEVIAPLSKLQGMLDNGKLDEVVKILKDILDYLKTIDFEFFGTVDGKVLIDFVSQMSNQYKRRTGGSLF